MFEASYLMKCLLLHVGFFLIFYVLSCYFFFLKFYNTSTISFRNEKNRSNVMTNFIFMFVNESPSTKTRSSPRALAL